MIMKKLIYLVVVLAFGLTVGVASGDVVDGVGEMIKINFQPQNSEVPEGYIIDYGLNFTSQNGLEYGFGVDGKEDDTLGGTRDRDGAHEDQRYDTHIQLWEGGWMPKSKTWEIAIDSGKYNIYIVCGDAVATDQVNTLDIEGTIVLDTDGQDNHDEHELYNISVTDGFLTVKEADDGDVENEDHYAHNAKLHFIHIEPEFLNPIIVDPNLMIAYETGETEGNFGVSMRNEPQPGATITVTVDPNNGGPSEDITFLGSTDPNGTVTLTFNDGNWDVPQTVVFKAIDDDIAEPQEAGDTLLEPQYILVSSAYSANPTDPNYVGNRTVRVYVMDNDQPDILFTITPRYNVVTLPGAPFPIKGDVQLSEEPFYLTWPPYDPAPWLKNIGVTLQLQPSGGDIKINVANEGISGNQPIMDPPLGPADDPNGLIFTAANWDEPQSITIWGVDDDVLQAKNAVAAGDQNYQAVIVFTVVDDGGDERYTDLKRVVDIDIADNECGAFGILSLDIGNSDPCAVDDDGNPLPDCYVDIHDAIEMAIQWLDCSDPQDPGCGSYL